MQERHGGRREVTLSRETWDILLPPWADAVGLRSSWTTGWSKAHNITITQVLRLLHLCLDLLSLFCWSHLFLNFSLAPRAPLSMGFPMQEYWSGLPFSPPGESSWPRDQTHVSCVSSTVRQILYHWATREASLPVTGPITTFNFELSSFLNSSSQNASYWDFSGGPVAKIPHSQCRGAWVPSLVGELDPTCHN